MRTALRGRCERAVPAAHPQPPRPPSSRSVGASGPRDPGQAVWTPLPAQGSSSSGPQDQAHPATEGPELEGVRRLWPGPLAAGRVPSGAPELPGSPPRGLESAAVTGPPSW